jgi:hypothetical protein
VEGGAQFSVPNLIDQYLPGPGVLAPGTYQVFALLARKGAFADNRLDPGDVLAIEVKEVTMRP